MRFIPAFIVVSGLLLVPVLRAQTPAAVIQEVRGTVEIQAPGASGWISASAGMTMEKAARISTGFKSSAVLIWGGATLTVRPLTRLTLEEIIERDGEEEIRLFLQAGRIRAEVTPPSGRLMDFIVVSPVAVSSVRGTAFEFDTVNLTVIEGRVRYVSVNGSLASVRAGERSTVDEKTYIVTPPREAIILTYTPPGAEAGGRLNGDGPAAIRDDSGSSGAYSPAPPPGSGLIVSGGW